MRYFEVCDLMSFVYVFCRIEVFVEEPEKDSETLDESVFLNERQNKVIMNVKVLCVWMFVDLVKILSKMRLLLLLRTLFFNQR